MSVTVSLCNSRRHHDSWLHEDLDRLLADSNPRMRILEVRLVNSIITIPEVLWLMKCTWRDVELRELQGAIARSETTD